MKLDIYSYIKNNSGYTLTATFYKRDKKVLETGLIDFSIEESISFLSEMNFFFSLNLEKYNELCKKLKFTLDKISEYFYFSKVHVQIFNSLNIVVREFSCFVNDVVLEDSSFTNSKKLFFKAYPLPWFMQKSTNYRVYIEKKVEDIIKDIFSDFEKMSFVKYEIKFKFPIKKNTTRINCIQNGESDWDFVLRLLDEEDWDFSFNHCDGNNILIIYDNIKILSSNIKESKHRKINLNIEDISNNLLKSETNPLKNEISFQNDRISNIQFLNYSAQTVVDIFDSDHREYGKVLIKKDSSKASGDHLLKIEKKQGFEGAKKYKEKSRIESFIGDKKESLNKKQNSFGKTASGDTNCLNIYLGTLITAKYSAFSKRPITSLLHEINSFRVEYFKFKFNFSGESNYEILTEMIMHPENINHSVEHDYKRNYIDGTITAKVFGKEKELNLDDDYFIKVQLPWQYDKYSDKADYIYARYMSPWANKSYGFYAIPRGGEEVLVAFEDGDPDLPVVIGGLYNEKRPAPINIKTKKHVLALYDQPSENKKNNFLEMDHKTATVNIAAAEHMRIRSFGDHLSQSKLTMKKISHKNMHSWSKEEMEFITEKNMLSTSKEQMELISKKNMLLDSKENIEIISNKEITIKSGDSIIKLDKSGNISITGKKIILKGILGELEIV